MIMIMIYGLSMALADSIPGVSGGTIAFVMGFYDRLISALHQLFGKDMEKRREAFFYLIKFAAGWGVGMVGSVLLLSHFFESNIYFLSSVFLGLTAGAIPIIIYEERDSLRTKKRYFIFSLVGAALVILLTVFRANSADISAVDFQNLSVAQYGFLFFCGIISASAMLLPGVSGSSMLLILGVYIPAINAIKELLHLHLQYLFGIAALAAGVLLGIILSSKLILKGLRNFRSQMIWLIIGLLIDSLYSVLMGPTTLNVPKPPVDFSSLSIPALLIGIVMVLGLEFIKYRMSNKENDGK